ncbi:MAG: radical SAM protein [Elusimicrobiota bacterium]
MKWLIKKLLKFTGTQKFLTVQMDITNLCNLNCIYCYRDFSCDNKGLSIDDWRKILDQYEKLLNKLYLSPRFCISGGEPTITNLFPKILSELSRRWPNAEISVLTNGTTISESMAGSLAKHKGYVQISIDGPDEERHDKIRGFGSFNKLMKGIETLSKGGIDISLQAILSSQTSFWIEDFFKLALKLKINSMNFARFIPQGRGKILYDKGIDRPLSALELRDAYANIVRCSNNMKIYTDTNKPLFVLISPKLGGHGKFGFQGLVIDYMGNLKVSSRTDFMLGNILKDGLEEIFLNHPIMKDLRAGKIEGCGNCKFYTLCGGDRNASYAAYGSFFKKDPGCWL